MFQWNIKPQALIKIPQKHRKCVKNHSNVYDDIDPNHLSLEQQKQIELEKYHMDKMNSRKKEILKIFEKLKNEFNEIKERNNVLPARFRLPQESFEIDERISEDIQKNAQNELRLMEEEMKSKIDSIKSYGKRIEHALLGNIVHWPTTLCGFR